MIRHAFAISFLLLSLTLYSQSKTIQIILPKNPTQLNRKAAEVLGKQIAARCNAQIVQDRSADLTIEFVRTKHGPPESFTISDGSRHHISISAADDAGIFYGVGKLLRSSRYDSTGFTAGSWRGASGPVGKMRGIYLATHFNNYYEAAPIEQVATYIEELALWGVNSLVIHFPNWQYTGFDDPAAQQALARSKQIFVAAKACGMKVGLLQVPNQAFKNTDTSYLNVPVPDPLGRRGHFGVNLDPANAGADKLLKENWLQLLDQFKDIGLDLMAYWPYDEGGCGCPVCWPWGARGYPKLSRELTAITKRKFPDVKIVLSTWMYDTPPAGEWEGLKQSLQQDGEWVDYIMADAHEDFPRYPIDEGLPSNLPLLNFPEISMWGQSPWGGYGANPLAGRFQRLWDQTKGRVVGGFPYSEGIYEDLNKVVCAQLYWNGSRPTIETVKEYIAYEYSPDVVDQVFLAMQIMEQNHLREQIGENALTAFDLIEEAGQKLTPQVNQGWRWRILYLRALIDRELFLRRGKLEGEVLKAAFNELVKIYHAQNAHSMPVRPQVIE